MPIDSVSSARPAARSLVEDRAQARELRALQAPSVVGSPCP
jgi:hypothetical protein